MKEILLRVCQNLKESNLDNYGQMYNCTIATAFHAYTENKYYILTCLLFNRLNGVTFTSTVHCLIPGPHSENTPNVLSLYEFTEYDHASKMAVVSPGNKSFDASIRYIT